MSHDLLVEGSTVSRETKTKDTLRACPHDSAAVTPKGRSSPVPASSLTSALTPSFAGGQWNLTVDPVDHSWYIASVMAAQALTLLLVFTAIQMRMVLTSLKA